MHRGALSPLPLLLPLLLPPLLLLLLSGAAAAAPQRPLTESGDSAFFLTQYLSDPQTARALSASQWLSLTAHSGFITVNASADSNMFFWHFPAQSGAPDAPLILWLQGGPGSSSLFGLFGEIGPLTLDAQSNLARMPTTWNDEYALLFIDNPVGTGFSYTSSGYVSDMGAMARDLYEALRQFLVVFSEYRSAPFFVAGESYAGKYIPALAAEIVQRRAAGQLDVPLTGVAIGDGFVDPAHQVHGYHAMLFGSGLIDVLQRDAMAKLEDQIAALAGAGAWHAAADAMNALTMDDGSFFATATGLPDYDDIRLTVEPAYPLYHQYLNQSAQQDRLHVGRHYMNDGSVVQQYLYDDLCKSELDDLAFVLRSGAVRVLLYNGQFDFICGPVTLEQSLPHLDWPPIGGFLLSKRAIWRDDTQQLVRGYVRSFDNLAQVVVRNAGHLVPFNQPEVAKAMISAFIDRKAPFT